MKLLSAACLIHSFLHQPFFMLHFNSWRYFNNVKFFSYAMFNPIDCYGKSARLQTACDNLLMFYIYVRKEYKSMSEAAGEHYAHLKNLCPSSGRIDPMFYDFHLVCEKRKRIKLQLLLLFRLLSLFERRNGIFGICHLMPENCHILLCKS